jgi:UDP-N-acetylglucosamine:LPS N-acetylglucosamine transferase
MDELYAIADIFVGKPGGLSTTESLRWNLPLLVTYTLPGQEEKNLQYLAERNLVLPRPENLSEAVRQELKVGLFREALKNNPARGEIIGNGETVVKAANQALFKAV